MQTRSRNQQKQTSFHAVGQVLAAILPRCAPELSPSLVGGAVSMAHAGPGTSGPQTADSHEGYFDCDLAEFPLFCFYKNRQGKPDKEPLRYSDAITGKNGQKINRSWTVYPGPFGFGGESTQVLLYQLIQLYVEQSCQGDRIFFGTLRALFCLRGRRNPSKQDYDRLRRDLDILRGYDFHCQNAFWDRQRQAYVDMKWRLFGSVCYFKKSATDEGRECASGFIEISPVLQHIARSRGFFALGFDSTLFYGLKPLEQRLAVYLAKKFTSQKLHRRFVDDLAQALPIGAKNARDVRAILKRAAAGLLDKRLPILDSFGLEKARNGRWLAVFRRKGTLRKHARLAPGAALDPEVEALVYRMVEAVGNREGRSWWARCAQLLGRGAVDRALGQLKEACQLASVKNRGGLLTKIFKDIAAERGVLLC